MELYHTLQTLAKLALFTWCSSMLWYLFFDYIQPCIDFYHNTRAQFIERYPVIAKLLELVPPDEETHGEATEAVATEEGAESAEEIVAEESAEVEVDAGIEADYEEGTQEEETGAEGENEEAEAEEGEGDGEAAEGEEGEEEGEESEGGGGSPIACTVCWLAVFACGITTYEPTYLFLLILTGFIIGYEIMKHADSWPISAAYMYGSTVIVCGAVMYAPYVTLAQLIGLAACVVFLEEFWKKPEDERFNLPAKKLLIVQCAVVGYVCRFVSYNALVCLVILLCAFALVDRYRFDNTYGVRFWAQWLAFCICIAEYPSVAMGIVCAIVLWHLAQAVNLWEHILQFVEKVQEVADIQVPTPRDIASFVWTRLTEFIDKQMNAEPTPAVEEQQVAISVEQAEPEVPEKEKTPCPTCGRE